jgi:hypothetical protein
MYTHSSPRSSSIDGKTDITSVAMEAVRARKIPYTVEAIRIKFAVSETEAWSIFHAIASRGIVQYPQASDSV